MISFENRMNLALKAITEKFARVLNELANEMRENYPADYLAFRADTVQRNLVLYSQAKENYLADTDLPVQHRSAKQWDKTMDSAAKQMNAAPVSKKLDTARIERHIKEMLEYSQLSPEELESRQSTIRALEQNLNSEQAALQFGVSVAEGQFAGCLPDTFELDFMKENISSALNAAATYSVGTKKPVSPESEGILTECSEQIALCMIKLQEFEKIMQQLDQISIDFSGKEPEQEQNTQKSTPDIEPEL